MPREEHSEEKLEHTSIDITVAIFALFIAFAVFGAYFAGIFDIYNRFLNWFYSYNWNAIINTIKIIVITLNFGMIAFLIYTLRKYENLGKTEPVPTAEIHIVAPQTEVAKNWQHIRELANSKNPSDWNMAVIRADALFDDTLQHKGYQGETLAERLTIVSPTILPSIDRVWSAHRLRNSIAHDPLEQHTKETIIAALRAYAEGLKEFGVLNVPEEK